MLFNGCTAQRAAERVRRWGVLQIQLDPGTRCPLSPELSTRPAKELPLRRLEQVLCVATSGAPLLRSATAGPPQFRSVGRRRASTPSPASSRPGPRMPTPPSIHRAAASELGTCPENRHVLPAFLPRLVARSPCFQAVSRIGPSPRHRFMTASAQHAVAADGRRNPRPSRSRCRVAPAAEQRYVGLNVPSCNVRVTAATQMATAARLVAIQWLYRTKSGRARSSVGRAPDPAGPWHPLSALP